MGGEATEALAYALLRLELGLRNRPPAPEAVAEVNRAFDRATLAFFAGQVQTVLTTLDSLTAVVEPEATVRDAQARTARMTLVALPGRGRVLQGDHPPIPWRLRGPALESVPEGGFPVVVALHGAGGNEHMFLEAYGAGLLGELADSRGFVVISPLTTALAQSPEVLAGLLDAAEAEFPLNRSQVVVVGHSMGAGAAGVLLERSGVPLLAVACLAGPCLTGEANPSASPPRLLVAGALDPLAPPSRMEAAAGALQSRGAPVEYWVLPDQGHTLMVGAVLEEVIDWLLARR
jgi:predicted esterase